MREKCSCLLWAMKPLREIGRNCGGSIETDLNLILRARAMFIWPGIETRGRLL